MQARIEADLKSAMKAGDKPRVATLRLLLAALKNEKIQAQRELTGDEFEAVLRRAVKQRRDSIEQYARGGRQDLVDAESRELAIIEEYLPKGLSDAEIEAALRDIIREKGFSTSQGRGPRDEGAHGGSQGPRRRKEGPGDRPAPAAVTREAARRASARRSRSRFRSGSLTPSAKDCAPPARLSARRPTRNRTCSSTTPSAGSREAAGRCACAGRPGGAILTYKGPARFQDGAKTREERETEVSDPEEARGDSRRLGLVPRFRYDKRREEWDCDGSVVALDETPVGTVRRGRGRPDDASGASSRFSGSTRRGDSLLLRRALRAAPEGGSRAPAGHGVPRGRLALRRRPPEHHSGACTSPAAAK